MNDLAIAACCRLIIPADISDPQVERSKIDDRVQSLKKDGEHVYLFVLSMLNSFELSWSRNIACV